MLRAAGKTGYPIWSCPICEMISARLLRNEKAGSLFFGGCENDHEAHDPRKLTKSYTNYGVTPIVETVVSLHTWFTKDLPFQSDHCCPELRSTGEAEVSSAGEQLTKE